MVGDLDLIRALALARIPCVGAANGTTPRSRYCTRVVTATPGSVADEFAALAQWARTAPAKPVLYYQQDDDLLYVSRHREALAPLFRFVVPAPELVETLADKQRFARLAKQQVFPVPVTVVASPGRDGIPDVPYPVVVKPRRREGQRWPAIAGEAKALHVPDQAALRRLWPRLGDLGEVVVQQVIAGPESTIESYHVYRDDAGSVRGEFTGRKLRTHPRRYGHTTAAVVTDAPDVTALGRNIIEALDLRGVAKVDMKRDPRGRLWVLEVNPRFNLWHHVGAAAGVNLPALVWTDLTGGRAATTGSARPGVTWCTVKRDLVAARGEGMSLLAWARDTAAATRPWPRADDPAATISVAAAAVRRAAARRKGQRDAVGADR